VIKIEDRAIFIADVHYPHHEEKIFELLSVTFLEQNRVTQIFFLGDIFDILFENSSYLLDYNNRLIEVINNIDKDIDIFYFEGNHDFNLRNIFPKIHIFSIENQPQKMRLKDKIVSISHGDKYEMSLGYRVYSKFIRNRTIIRYFIPFKERVIKNQITLLKRKKICKKIEDFNQIIDRILSHYPKSNLILEAHYHQGIILDNYVSLPSLACQDKIGIVDNGEILFMKI